MKNYNWRFLAAGLLLAALIFALSLDLFPKWRRENLLLVALAALAITVAFGFLANFRQVTQDHSPEPQPAGERALTINTSLG